MDDIDRLAAATQAAFETVHRRAFLGDPTVNPKLVVEVVAPAVVAGIPTLVLIAPWTLNGLFFPAAEAPAELVVGSRRLPVFATHLDEIGEFRSVNLTADVSIYADRAAATAAATALAEPFRAAVAQAFAAAPLAQPRRDLFRRLAGG